MSEKKVKVTNSRGQEVSLELWSGEIKNWKEQDINLQLGPGKSLVVGKQRMPRKLKKRLGFNGHIKKHKSID
jgi:hypothetical protein